MLHVVDRKADLSGDRVPGSDQGDPGADQAPVQGDHRQAQHGRGDRRGDHHPVGVVGVGEDDEQRQQAMGYQDDVDQGGQTPVQPSVQAPGDRHHQHVGARIGQDVQLQGAIEDDGTLGGYLHQPGVAAGKRQQACAEDHGHRRRRGTPASESAKSGPGRTETLPSVSHAAPVR